MTLLGGIDAGGTTFKLVIGRGPDEVMAEHRVPTTTPDETIAAVRSWFAAQPAISSLGIGAFGPLGLDRTSSDYGHILITTKAGWSGTDLLGALRTITSGPTSIDLDVVAAALAERAQGAGRGIDSFGYVTVGTGIGMGLIVKGVPVGGRTHPEAGHIFVPRASGDDGFAGACAHHRDCVEGLACAAAVRARWGDPESLGDEHPAWGILGHYLGHLAHAAVMLTGADRIALGGGIGARPILAYHAAKTLERLVGSYDSITMPRGGPAAMIVPAMLGSRSGEVGALLLAERALTG